MSEREIVTCGLCGEPMPPGEEMFNYHGYSGPCPKKAGEPTPPATPQPETPEPPSLANIQRADYMLNHYDRRSRADILVLARHLDQYDAARVALSPPPDVERLTRPETGPMQFGDDWPGLFIRGDNAAGFGLTLDKLIDFAAKKGLEPFTLLEAVGLRRMFSAADARTQPDVQRAVLLSSTPGEPT